MGSDGRLPPGSQPQRGCTVALQIGHGVMQPGAVLLEESMDFHARLKAQQMPNLGLGKALGPVALHSQSFQGRTGDIRTAGDHLRGQFIRNVQRDLHSMRIPPVESLRC